MSKLPILDSFIKEAIRVNPLEKSEYLAGPLDALGHVDPKDVEGHSQKSAAACDILQRWSSYCRGRNRLHVRDIMHNEEKYLTAHQFDGHRFINKSAATSEHLPSHDGNMRGTTLTDASQDFPIWEYGSKVW